MMPARKLMTTFATLIVSLGLLASLAQAALAQTAVHDIKDEAALLQILQSGNKPDIALACKRLAVHGSDKAVAPLAALLGDAELASWARIPLEAIPGPVADAALRNAMPKHSGKLLIGVINSIAARRDGKAVEAIAAKLNTDTDPVIVVACGAALGRIADDAAAKALESAVISGKTPDIRHSAAWGAILCGEVFLHAKKNDAAAVLFDAVRKADVSVKQRQFEATRGAILARGDAGIPLLVEQLKSPDRAMLRVGLRTARELPGAAVQKALAAEFPSATIDRKALIIAVLADRAEPESLSLIQEATAAKANAPEVRVAAIEALEVLGNASVVPALLVAAVAEDAAVSSAAKSTLARLQGKEVEAALLAGLEKSQGKQRQTLIELASSRRIEGSFPVIIRFAEDPDPGVRSASIDTIGFTGDATQAADLVKLIQKTTDASERSQIERNLNTLTGRNGSACVPHLAPLMQSNDPAVRGVALRALAGAGGPDALATVKAALEDKEEAVADEAVRTLSTWPNRWPEDTAATESLLAMAKAPQKPAHKVLALRGYFQFLQGNKKLPDDEKVAKINELLPLLTRPEEKRQAISVLGSIGNAPAVEQLIAFANDETVSEEACAAILNNKNLAKLPKASREKALKTVAEKAKNPALK